jgi:TonB family protein
MSWSVRRSLGVVGFLFLMVIGSAGASDDSSPLVADLNRSYGGKSAMLQNFYCGSHLKYDVDGTPLGSWKPGPWAKCGFLEINKFEVTPKEVTLIGQRFAITFDDGRMVSVKSGLVKITIQGPPARSLGSIENAFGKIFYGKEQKLADVVPDYWRCYAMNPALKYGDRHCTPRVAVDEKRESVKKGIATAPRPISDPDPFYTQDALRAHLQGMVVLEVEVTGTGSVENISVIRPLGLGLDEAAVNAVSKWKFKPATRNDGTPARVVVNIEINFHLGM